MKYTPNALLLILLMSGLSRAQSAFPFTPNLTRLADNPKAAVNRTVTGLLDGQRKGVHVDKRPDEGLVWIPNVHLANGVIEFDVRGKDVLQQSFVGVAFHGQNDITYEAIYFRPFNFRSIDSVRRGHAVQYIAQPTFTWQKLRTDFPNKYEAALISPPNPNDWFHVRVEITLSQVRVFVNRNHSPTLTVQRIVQTADGRIGLWVGNGSGGDFANLTLLPAL